MHLHDSTYREPGSNSVLMILWSGSVKNNTEQLQYHSAEQQARSGVKKSTCLLIRYELNQICSQVKTRLKRLCLKPLDLKVMFIL